MKHYSVLKAEVIENLCIDESGIYVDGTLGYAGHSQDLLKRIKRGFLFAFDQDAEAIKHSDEVLKSVGQNYKIFHTNFCFMKSVLQDEGITQVDGILFDLGFSSPQIDDESRGFSFMKEAILDMRMDQRQDLDARIIVNNYSVEELTNIFYIYGEEPRSRDIAKKIVNSRKDKEINTTTELVSIIESGVGAKYFNLKHPERNIFQAIRIEVNSELTVLSQVLPDAIDLLKSGGRLCVITFHSLEDRIVKQIFKKYSEVNDLVKGLPVIPEEYKPIIKLINRKPILPGEQELEENSRSRSAKLRIIERI